MKTEEQIQAEFNPYTSLGYPFGTKEAIAAVKGFEKGVEACAEYFEQKLAEKDEVITALRMGWNESVELRGEAQETTKQQLEESNRELDIRANLLADAVREGCELTDKLAEANARNAKLVEVLEYVDDCYCFTNDEKVNQALAANEGRE